MKKNVWIIMLLFIMSSFSTELTAQEKAPFMTRTFPASSIQAVETNTLGGDHAITGDVVSEASVEVWISHDNWSYEKIKQTLEANYTIDIRVENGTLYVTAKPKDRLSDWNQNGVNISFVIVVPKQVSSNSQSVGGNFFIRNLSGTQKFNNVGGSLTVENVSGKIDASTVGGSITVTGSKDSIDLNTVGSSIVVKDCSGKINISNTGGGITANGIKGALKIGAMNGDVKLDNISGKVDAGAFNGNLDVKMTSVTDSVRLSNNGNISLSLPAGKGYNLHAKGNKVETIGLKDFHGTQESDNIDGTAGKGGAEISVTSSMETETVDKNGNTTTVKTSSGRVRISFE